MTTAINTLGTEAQSRGTRWSFAHRTEPMRTWRERTTAVEGNAKGPRRTPVVMERFGPDVLWPEYVILYVMYINYIYIMVE